MISRAERIFKKVFFKGGSSGGENYDAAYNDRMASIAETQQGMADEYFQFWKTGSGGSYEDRPVEITPASSGVRQVSGSNVSGLDAYENGKIQNEFFNIPAVMGTEKVWVPDGSTAGYRDMEQAQKNANMEMKPLETALAGKQINDSMRAIDERAPVRSAFYDESLNGVDINSRVDRAAADATQAFLNSDNIMRRNSARMGVNPNSGRFSAMQNTNSLNQAKTVAGAKTTARTQAELENYGRLNQAMGYGG